MLYLFIMLTIIVAVAAVGVPSLFTKKCPNCGARNSLAADKCKRCAAAFPYEEV